MPTRRGLVLAAASMPLIAHAQTERPHASWPTRPLRVIVPYAPGGQTDTVARLIQPRLAAALGQPVVIENRSGAGGSIGAGLVANAPADGYTLLFDAASFLIVPLAIRNLPFDYEHAFAPVGLATAQPYVLAVTASFPAADLASFVRYGRGKPISYGSPGVGSIGHLAGALLGHAAGLTLEHITYRGGAEAAADLLAGNLEAAVLSASSLEPLLPTGKARAIGLTSRDRSPLLPQVPPIASSGYPDVDLAGWNALFARSGTPEPVLERLEQALRTALEDPQTGDALRRIGSEPGSMNRAAFGAQLERERALIRRIVADTRITF
ncbi:Bug family tripartite tricarboxylate transporter substrate binding protein [Pararoseomonas indoligenes]|uniref:Tripartite tricarboxylate transporter substrate binding protein n=1 Tax=Roseomonas indoligenes TaxID=2820811 RepID=A0A940S658_9PROT|nr:tripartite tricarboxylate transporter substrate binding protein [Pararoseomonas indoligenes]MBP0495161.1 tripartite tricarboxylate transporter substrate binding protein [Pararoseomonas indoligenes]